MTIKANFPATRPSLLLDFSNTKVLDPRITFSRGSTATYYDEKTVAKAEENLLTYSQDFDNALWIKQGITVTANATTAPDGNMTAAAVFESASGSAVRDVYKSTPGYVSGNIYTLSVYVKSNGIGFVSLSLGSGPAAWFATVFNLSTGAITQNSQGASGVNQGASSVAAGNGWYRLSVTGYTNISNPIDSVVFLSDTGTPVIGNYGAITYTGTGTSGIYLWGAQLEQRSTVTAYTPTTTAPITNYIPALKTAAANVARFDHVPVTGESKGLLIEEQRTNLLTYSALVYNVINTNVVQDTVAPDGTVSGCSIVASAANTTAYAARVFTSFTSGTVYTFSIYVKRPATTPYVFITSNSGAVIPYSTIFDIDAISVTAGTGIITSVGNGWYRLSVTATCGTTGMQTIYAVPAIDGTTTSSANFKQPTYVGQVMIQQWGAQLEAGSFATSYIPTTSAQVTRAADSASITGTNFSSWFNASEGTVVGEFSSATNGGAQITGDVSGYGFEVGTSGGQAFHYNNSTNLFSANPVSVAVNVFRKVAATGDGLSRSVCLNGGTVATSATPLLVNKPQNGLKIGSAASGSFANGPIKRITYYPKRLSNTQLQSLTS